MAPRDGFEPSTNRLTAGCSTAELPGNGVLVCNEAAYSKELFDLQRAFFAFFIFSSIRLDLPTGASHMSLTDAGYRRNSWESCGMPGSAGFPARQGRVYDNEMGG